MERRKMEGKPTIILVSAKKVNPYENVYLDADDGGVQWPEGLHQDTEMDRVFQTQLIHHLNNHVQKKNRRQI